MAEHQSARDGDTRSVKMAESEIKTEFLFEVKIPQGPHHLIGDGPLGTRRITYPSSGATAQGPRLNGTVLAGGGDPFLLRTDGVGEVDARITIQADEGDLIMMSYKGLLVYGQKYLDAQARGEGGPQDENYFYVSVLFETASERYRWLNATVAVARGFIPEDLPPPCIGYRVYALI